MICTPSRGREHSSQPHSFSPPLRNRPYKCHSATLPIELVAKCWLETSPDTPHPSLILRLITSPPLLIEPIPHSPYLCVIYWKICRIRNDQTISVYNKTLSTLWYMIRPIRQNLHSSIWLDGNYRNMFNRKGKKKSIFVYLDVYLRDRRHLFDLSNICGHSDWK